MTKYSDPRAQIVSSLLLTFVTHVPMRFTTHVDFKNGGLHGIHNKMRNTRYFHGIMKWAVLMEAMMVTMLSLNTLTLSDSDGSFDFQGKNDSKRCPVVLLITTRVTTRF